MKTRIIVSIAFLAGIAACSTAKKNTRTPEPTATAAATVSPTPAPPRPASGIYEPGQEELMAIQEKFGDASLGQLKQGHMIYSLGACVQCHKAMNIYQRNEAQWEGIITDMARRAGLTATQKDAVYRYVLAVKAVKARQERSLR